MNWKKKEGGIECNRYCFQSLRPIARGQGQGPGRGHGPRTHARTGPARGGEGPRATGPGSNFCAMSSGVQSAGEVVGSVRPRVGVLALQGSFREHASSLSTVGAQAVEARGAERCWRERVALPRRRRLAHVPPRRQVRKAEHLHGLLGLIIPGGESTTMALVAERWGLVRCAAPPAPPLRHALPGLRAA